MSHRVGVVGDGKLLKILEREDLVQDKIMKIIVEAKDEK